MQSHLDYEMYGDKIDQSKMAAIANKQQEYYELVYTVFNTRAGKKLFKHFKEALCKPIYDTDPLVMARREGERLALITLMSNYEEGTPKQ